MDLLIVEYKGNGGDAVFTGKDLMVIDSFENMVYLALFGGCVEQDTPRQRPAGVQDFSYWGNSLESNSDVHFNSLTERTLNTTPLTSAGRISIENAIRADLRFMQAFAKVVVETAIIATDKLTINITLTELATQAQQVYQYIWDAAAQALSFPQFVPPQAPIVLNGAGFQYELQQEF